MSKAEELAAFAVHADYRDMSPAAQQQLKLRVLDALGCAIGALDGQPVLLIRRQIDDFAERGRCTLIGGGSAAPDRTALYNSALVRYLDFNDSYLAKGETCHPSDNAGAMLAATEYAGGSGNDFLSALAVAYQVQCRLSDEAPVRAKGFDHTTQGAFAVAAGVSRALKLDQTQTANAIAISGTSNIALHVTRTGALSHWKGLAYPNTAFGATHAAFLAMRGITGPMEVFEGNKGFMDAIAGRFTIDWSQEDLERVTRTVVKEFNAEIHSQSAIEAMLDLKAAHGLTGDQVQRIEIDTFDVAYNIIGGGEEGDKTLVQTKEGADHSLQYMVAVALLDGQVMPSQYRLQRILAPDVQALLRRVLVRPNAAYSNRFPAAMPSRVTVTLDDGRQVMAEKQDYEGFFTRPATWASIERKFNGLAAGYAGPALRQQIIEAVGSLETLPISALMRLLARVKSTVA